MTGHNAVMAAALVVALAGGGRIARAQVRGDDSATIDDSDIDTSGDSSDLDNSDDAGDSDALDTDNEADTGDEVDNDNEADTGIHEGDHAPASDAAGDDIVMLLPNVRITGYLQPAAAVRYRPDAVPLDRWTWGAEATRTGVIFAGDPFEHWNFLLHVVVGANIFQTIRSIDVIDRDGDGSPEDIDARTQDQPGLLVEQATVSYAPLPTLDFHFGQMRIPFTVQNQSPNTALMFPSRSGPNEVFLSGTDLGALATFAPSARFKVQAGVFNGTDATSFMEQVRGVLLALRADANLLGAFPFAEGDPLRGPLRIGIGAGLLYFPAQGFDSTGFAGASIRDLRASASVRVAVEGFYLQAEVLRRQRTDSLSNRPLIATGGYGQVSYYIRMAADLGVAPIARWGITTEDQSFSPRTTMWSEAGVAFYINPTPEAPNKLKLTLHVLDERRLTEGENAHGAIAQLQLRF
ncbi:MAG TPA: hypothetical protein VFG83_12830 [Kofleriaceae bacterium]|nr:hypothetical protein [Kofleriaceae bacterium]